MNEGLLVNVFVTSFITVISFVMAKKLNKLDFASRVFRYFWIAAGLTYLFDSFYLANSYVFQVTTVNFWNSAFYWLSHLAGSVSLALIPVISLYLLVDHKKIKGIKVYYYPAFVMAIISALALSQILFMGWLPPQVSTYDVKLMAPQPVKMLEMVLLIISVFFTFAMLLSLRQVEQRHMKHKVVFLTISLAIYLVAIVVASLSTSSLIPRTFVSASVLAAYMAFFHWTKSVS